MVNGKVLKTGTLRPEIAATPHQFFRSYLFAFLFWMGIATSTQGFVRLVSGPIWGVLADRFGRKLMFIRSLYAASLTTVIAAVATEPWHIVVALSAQGLLSGFIPAAVALTSVSVPDRDLTRSLGTVTGAQFLGGTLGPSAGALLAAGLGYRGAIWISAALPAVAATWVVFMVTRDRVSPAAKLSHRTGCVGAQPETNVLIAPVVSWQLIQKGSRVFGLAGS